MAVLYEYLGSIGAGWWTLLGVLEGSLIVAERVFSWKIPRWAYLAVLIIFLPVAGFDAWKDQRYLTEKAAAEKMAAENDRAALQERLDQAMGAIERLRTVPEQKELTFLRERIDELNAVRGELESEKQARGELEQQLNALRAATGPRVIADAAERALGEGLRDLGPPNSIDIAYAGACGDCPELASAFLRIFKSAGWEVPEYKSQWFMELGLWLSSGTEDDEQWVHDIRKLISCHTGITCQYLRHPGKGLKLQIGRRE